jgi:hypothetical protein
MAAMKLRLLNPVARKRERKNASAPRLADIDGKVIGLYWNTKFGGDAALARTAELLKQRYPAVTTRSYVKKMGVSPAGAAEALATVAKECVAVIGSTAE